MCVYALKARTKKCMKRDGDKKGDTHEGILTLRSHILQFYNSFYSFSPFSVSLGFYFIFVNSNLLFHMKKKSQSLNVKIVVS